MRIRVKLFGQLADAAGGREVEVELTAPANCAALRAELACSSPGLAALLPACRFAVNHAFATEDQPIREGDEVALIGLVSGG